MNWSNDKEYEKSNKIESVYYNKLSTKEYNALLNCGESYTERQRAAKALITYLCNKYKLEVPQVIVKDTTGGNILGKYTRKGNILGTYTQSIIITIYNKTPKNTKVKSIKQFAETLLHEFIHHYDLNYLKFSHSPHTRGFYMRISDLKRKLEGC